MTLGRVLLAIAVLVLAAGAFAAWKVGPRNIIGFLLYDQRREGLLKVGDRAPDVALVDLDGRGAQLQQYVGGQPLVVIFGSFT